ncbi:MAG: type II toxin-antitoxin system VapC family toxin [Chloroflexi bacterium]|nr:type II toxin-antitoxin system VapC family toxin [Chloroflexota bacterium]
MQLPDVNPLVYAFRPDLPEHAAYHDWLTRLLQDRDGFGVSELVLSGFLRVVTNPRVFRTPSTTGEALEFAERLRRHPRAKPIAPRSRHWGIFASLCRGLRGNDIPDAYLAALAIESGCEWISADRGFARFPGLTWRHPLD